MAWSCLYATRVIIRHGGYGAYQMTRGSITETKTVRGETMKRPDNLHRNTRPLMFAGMNATMIKGSRINGSRIKALLIAAGHFGGIYER